MANKKNKQVPYRFVPLPRGVYTALDGLSGSTVTLYLWLWESINTFKTPGSETFSLTSNEIHITTGWAQRSIQRGISELVKNNLVSRKSGVGNSFIIEFRTDFESESDTEVGASGAKSGACRANSGASDAKSGASGAKSGACRANFGSLPQSENSPQTRATTGPKGSSDLPPLYYSLDTSFKQPLKQLSKIASGEKEADEEGGGNKCVGETENQEQSAEEAGDKMSLLEKCQELDGPMAADVANNPVEETE